MISKPRYKVAENSAAYFIGILNGYKNCLPQQEYKTIKGQALAGDVFGARRGFNRLLRKKGVLEDEECI